MMSSNLPVSSTGNAKKLFMLVRATTVHPCHWREPSQVIFCRDKHAFVATKDVFCRDKEIFLATKMILVGGPANDAPQGDAVNGIRNFDIFRR